MQSFLTHSPHGGDPGQASEFVPLRTEIHVTKLLPCPFQAPCSVFERQQCRIADQQRSIAAGEHRVEVGRMLHEIRGKLPEVTRHDLHIGESRPG